MTTDCNPQCAWSAGRPLLGGLGSYRYFGHSRVFVVHLGRCELYIDNSPPPLGARSHNWEIRTEAGFQI